MVNRTSETPEGQEPRTGLEHSYSGSDDDIDKGDIVREYRRVMSNYSFIGIEFGCAVVFGIFFGGYLDDKWDTSPWMVVTCLLIGFAAAGKDFLRAVRRAGTLGQEPPIEPEEQ